MHFEYTPSGSLALYLPVRAGLFVRYLVQDVSEAEVIVRRRGLAS